ncbi:hypothetical protein HYR54_09195 [Candidatus Acetothermia bacterium]|nr:hypothetical protein [Candidatus Acetothermia bacterium]
MDRHLIGDLAKARYDEFLREANWRRSIQPLTDQPVQRPRLSLSVMRLVQSFVEQVRRLRERRKPVLQ